MRYKTSMLFLYVVYQCEHVFCKQRDSHKFDKNGIFFFWEGGGGSPPTQKVEEYSWNTTATIYKNKTQNKKAITTINMSPYHTKQVEITIRQLL